MTVIDFYLARIAETEAVAESAGKVHPDWGNPVRSLGANPETVLVYYPAEHVLADCQAKRHIVAMYQHEAAQTGPAIGNQESHTARLGALADAIQTLAAAYKDHEDWNPDWGADEPGSNQ